MTASRPVDERIALWMLEEAPDEPPNRVLQAAFDATRQMPQERSARGPLATRRRLAILAAATLVVGATLVASALVGGWLATREPSPSPDALERIQSAGVIRVAVRPDHPQANSIDGALEGFDVDVALELGRRLGLRVEIVGLSPEDQLTSSGSWDVGLPSTPAWAVHTSLATTTAYYAWPHLLVVPADSGATSVEDVQGQPICAVRGDAGQAWLLGRYGPTPSAASSPPIPSTLVLRASDAECLAALKDGEVRGIVTATLTPSDVAGLVDVRAIDGPVPELRAATVVAGGDVASLIDALNGAIDAARADGTLGALSQSRFGADLTGAVR
jgi:polar amino acid transport system substrate-binding protein